MLRTLLVTVLFSLSTAAVAAPTADACGGGPEVRHRTTSSPLTAEARVLVDRHFSALAKGKARAVRRLWSKDAQIVSYAADGTVLHDRLATALKRWLRHRKGMRWTIESASERFDGGVDVSVTVTWGGATYADVLTVMPDSTGALKLVAKTTSSIATELAAAPSPY